MPALIVTLMAGSKWEQASATADALARQASQSAVSALYPGLILGARRNYLQAEEAFGKALALNPSFVPALYYRADVWVALGNAENAKRDLQRILARDSTVMAASKKLTEISSQDSPRPR